MIVENLGMVNSKDKLLSAIALLTLVRINPPGTILSQLASLVARVLACVASVSVGFSALEVLDSRVMGRQLSPPPSHPCFALAPLPARPKYRVLKTPRKTKSACSQAHVML